MPRGRKGPKKPKAKQVKVDLIDATMKPALEPYRLMKEIRGEFHKDTRDAKVVLAWMLDTKQDVDGHICLGKCVRASDLQKELVDYDFVILLNKEIWESKDFGVEKKKALMDHECMHIAEALDKEGEPKFDSKGRKIWRTRGHDIAEFSDIVRRHGTYKKDLERFAEALLKQSQAPLFNQESEGAAQVVQ